VAFLLRFYAFVVQNPCSQLSTMDSTQLTAHTRLSSTLSGVNVCVLEPKINYDQFF
jgi:hypothetical protein